MDIYHIVDPLITHLSPVSLIKFISTNKYFYNKHADVLKKITSELLHINNKFFQGTMVEAVLTSKRFSRFDLCIKNIFVDDYGVFTRSINQYEYYTVYNYGLSTWIQLFFPSTIANTHLLNKMYSIPLTHEDEISISQLQNHNIKNCRKYKFSDVVVIVVTGPFIYEFN